MSDTRMNERRASAGRREADRVATVQHAVKAELVEALRIIVANAVVVPDPQMNGTTDTYAVPLDDIESARAALKKAGL